MNGSIEELGQSAVWVLLLAFFFVLIFMAGVLFFGWWVAKKRGTVSPFSKKPMMLGVDMPFSIAKQIEEFVKSLPQPENPPFEMSKAAVCRETGRIIPNAVMRGEIVRLTPRYINERYPGNWVSWGSLTEEQKGIVKLHHREIPAYQMEHSSRNRFPQSAEQYYAVMKPGPLYVDMTTKTFLGWLVAPGTYFEVLVVKKPDFESIEEVL